MTIFTYRRGTGDRECGERDRLPPRRRSLPTGEPLRWRRSRLKIKQ
jgi:hypothetical protein